ncbi:hypothetical protein Tco_0283110 [Tanacetum coccineum]
MSKNGVLYNKLGEAIHKAIQSHSAECRDEAQAKKHEYIDLVDTSVRAIIKEEVKTQLPQVLPQAVSDFATPVIEKSVIESLEVAVLAKSSSQLKSTYEAAASLLEGREAKDKDQDPSVGSDRGTKRSKSSKETESSRDPKSKESKSSSSSKGNSHSQYKSSGKFAHVEEPSKQYPFDLRKPLQLIPDHRVHQVIPLEYFINNDLEYLKGGDLNRKYSTSVTKTKAATYELPWIKDMVPTLWSPIKVVYDKHAYWGTSHWVTSLKIMKQYDYGHLDEIKVHREDQQLYKFKEGNFPRLRLQDIEDMLLLLVQQKMTNLMIDEHFNLNVALRMFTRRIVIQRRVEDLQLGVESYQKKLNLTKPDIFKSDLRKRTAFTAYSDPQGVIYVDNNNRNRLMHTDELHKFSDGNLNSVRTAL